MPSSWRGHLGGLLLIGLAGSAAAADGLPPLTVDPTLLGLPPAVKKPAPPAPAPAPPAPAPASAAPAPAPAAPQPVAAPAPVAAPEAPKPAAAPVAAPPAAPLVMEKPQLIEPAPAARPAPPPVVRKEEAKPQPMPQPAAAKPVAAPAPSAQPVTPAAPAPAPAVVPAPLAPVASVGATAVAGPSGLPPLRVDPALLGAPPPRRPVAVAEASRPAAAPAGGSAAASAPSVAVASPQPVESASAVPSGQPAILWVSAPPEVEDSAVLPPTYSAHAAAGRLPAPKLKASSAMAKLSADDGLPRPTFLRADRIQGKSDVETVAEGSVEMRRLGTILDADRLTYWHADDEVEAKGNVRLQRPDGVISGPELRMRLAENTGYFDRPVYSMTRMAKVNVRQDRDALSQGQGEAPTVLVPVTGSGEAERIDFEGEGLYRLIKGTYSTCAPGERDWYAEVDELGLDYNQEVGEASNATVYFKDVPLFYSPWLSFSINNQRKSGFLSPTWGSTSNSGFELMVPWYWNIAPNMDATIAPRMMSKRGVQWNSELRYLDYNYNGQARFEYLPDDQVARRRRSGYSLSHTQSLGRGFAGSLNLNGVSDGTYFSDLSSRLSVVSQTNLLRQGTLSYSGDRWWGAQLLAQSYQTLQDPSLPAVDIPYRRLPQLSISAARPDLPLGLNAALSGVYTDFSHPTKVLGKRIQLHPQLSLPMQTAAFHITPKIGIHATRYVLDRQGAGVPGQINRNVPIFSVDSKVVFERDVSWFDRNLLQTLEPRLYYLYVPNKDQSQIPVFDSGVADFNFAQIFAENRYSGWDRLGDANQMTAALTSQLIDPATGAELMRGMIGQRFYFTTQHVTMPAVGATPAEVPRTNRKTDLLAAFSGQVLPKTYLDTGWQYSPSFSRTERLTASGRYQPEPGKVLNAGYRYARDQLGQVDVAGQWRLFGGWHGVGRYNYSIKENRVVETIGGLEYDGGCWAARFVVQRLATQVNRATTAVFFQLELNGFSRIGSSPLDLLKRTIPGYGIINQPTADPAFAEN